MGSPQQNDDVSCPALSGVGALIPTGLWSLAVCARAHDPERRAALGQSGRAYAEEYLSRDKVLVRFEAELLRLVCG
jgi:hypothetical protein